MADLVDGKTVNPPPADPYYHPQDALGLSTRAIMLTGTAGLFLAAIQNTVTKQNVGAFGVISRFGSTVGIFAAAGGAYQFATSVSANLRQKDDFVNNTIGGAIAGALMGAAKRKAPAVALNAFLLGTAAGVVGFTQASTFASAGDDPQIDRIAEKDAAKKRFRRPINETINELGEGRGIYGPGYEERRKQRLKENYGIDVPEPYYKSTPS
ncbi:hypothetical protein LTR84_003619 [Exophiala bonariae]|uniref:NADH-ubiquinone oxidoreductase subunit B14.7 n=1 Tax=Exophiala bonariae TaxID=1690606 RepID=A0AAV9N9S7_9EURO|nr:hypothetical protein LTR84_003619 [Exophiala bonariae]